MAREDEKKAATEALQVYLNQENKEDILLKEIYKQCRDKGADLTQLKKDDGAPLSFIEFIRQRGPSRKDESLGAIDTQWYVWLICQSPTPSAEWAQNELNYFTTLFKDKKLARLLPCVLECLIGLGAKPTPAMLDLYMDSTKNFYEILMVCRKSNVFSTEEWKAVEQSYAARNNARTDFKNILASFVKEPVITIPLEQRSLAKNLREASSIDLAGEKITSAQNFNQLLNLKELLVDIDLIEEKANKNGSKEDIIKEITRLPLDKQLAVVEECLKEGTQLYKFFATKRGLFNPNQTSGTFRLLNQIKADLQRPIIDVGPDGFQMAKKPELPNRM